MGLVFNSSAEAEDLLVQQRCGWTGAKGRLRREDCKFVKHDKLFSKWKVLLGPSNFADHQVNSAGMKDKSSCHVHNLPATQCGPGVYELGVTAPSWSKALNNTRALKREDVIPVYVGQAANIRQRLQKYGQAGAQIEQAGSRSPKLHRGENDSVGSRSPWMAQSGLAAKSSGSGPRLFSEVFALGSSIAFRWAHTDSKVVAEQVESELLAVFDFAWNKSTTGTRRSRDILAKLFMAWPTKTTTPSSRLRNLIFSGRRSLTWLPCGRTSSVGIKVALRKPQNPTSSILSSLCFHMTVQPQRSIMACNAPPRKMNMKFQAAETTRREYACSTKAKKVEAKTQVERRRNSLSFNTWVKGESHDQRVHDSSKMSELSANNASVRKLSVRSDSRRRVQHLRSKYASLCNSDSMRSR